MDAWLWLALATPAAGAAAVRLLPGAARPLAAAAALASALPSWVLLEGAASGERARPGFEWLTGTEGLEVGLRLDPLSAVMSATVATAGLVIVFYSTGYFAGSGRAPSALAGLLAFLAAMQGLVLADGYLALLVFWELVGAMSARLIAWSRDDPAAPGGAVRAFLTTRTADLGFYLALLALYTGVGTVAFGTGRPEGALGALVGVGLVAAAMGKSAQVPLQTWLSGAMAGPTPVSALLHSATMVAAGVYLIVRSQDLLAGWPLEAAGWVGALTAVAGAAIALAQRDLKRVLAGSTTSQLGLMFLGAAAGGPAVAIFLLIAHAAGKAGMFLATGIFQHARGSTALADLRGAGREDPAAFAAFAIGAASVAAVPPLAAFWAKDGVLAAAEGNAGWFVLALIAGAGSAAYLLRPTLILWGRGPARGQASKGRAAPGGRATRGAMLAGAVALAAGSVVLGAVGAPLERLLDEPAAARPAFVAALSLAAVAVGAGAILTRLSAPALLRRVAAAQLFGNEAIRALAERPLFALSRLSDVADRRIVDDAVDGGARAGLSLAAVSDRTDRRGVDAAVDGLARAGLSLAAVSDRTDRRGVDAAVDGLARLVGRGGDRASGVQSGQLYEYLRDTVAGVAAIGFVISLTALT